MSLIADTPQRPYYAAIFSRERPAIDEGYTLMAQHMLELAQRRPGFLCVESARENIGITVSYWADLESIKRWKINAEHLEAQQLGHAQWYRHLKPASLKSNATMAFDSAI